MSTEIKLSSPASHEFWEIPVVYVDEHLLALNKSPGLLLAPDPVDPGRPSLVALLHDGIAEGKPWARQLQLSFLMNAHRLDVEASGVCLFARTKPVLAALGDLFGSGKPYHRYVALAQGSPPADTFEVDAGLAPHPLRAGLMCVDNRAGKHARTGFKVVERFAGWVLLECEPFADRPHQIRVHLRQAGFPMAGDRAYGGRNLLLSSLKSSYRLKPKQVERPLISQPTFHAGQLRLIHPVTQLPLEIGAAWPKDLTVAVKYLRKYSSA